MLLKLEKTVRKPEFWFMLATLIIVMAVGFISSIFRLGWKSASILSFGMYAIILGFSFLTSDKFLKRLLFFGIIAGLTELLVDCWLVTTTQTLVYVQGEPMIACSPVYMPFSWAVILMQIGYVGWLIAKEESLFITIVITACIGAAVIPLFEHWAKNADWWFYHNSSRMIGNTPYFIAAGEALLCAILPVFFTAFNKRNILVAGIFGFLQGLWIWISYLIFYHIFK